jgi:hypothetical protein
VEAITEKGALDGVEASEAGVSRMWSSYNEVPRPAVLAVKDRSMLRA